MPDQIQSNQTVIDWTARSEQPPRSVFGNYAGGRARDCRREDAQASAHAVAAKDQSLLTSAAPDSAGLQSAIDLAMARAFVYAFLSRAFADPAATNWQWLCDPGTTRSLRLAWAVLTRTKNARAEQTYNLSKEDRPEACPTFTPEQLDSFHADYLAAFGHAARGRCPLNEIEYGDIKADPLFQPHRLADIAAFYRAFGLEVADDAAERHDHICLELEFMSVLTAREAYALEHQADPEQLAVCLDAQRKFLREHPGRWLPAFTRRLIRTIGPGALASLAGFTREFILGECARFGVAPGSDDLLLRPADSAGGSLCDSCGLGQVLPGANAPAAI